MLRVDINGPVESTFLFHSCILIAKTLMMELLVQWETLKSTAYEEYLSTLIDTADTDRLQLQMNHKKEGSNENIETKIQVTEKVERIKRAHWNDIENIPIFIALGFIYVITKPDPETAKTIFRIFTIARIVHTYVYAIHVIPQPARAIAFITGELVTWYMIIRGITHSY